LALSALFVKVSSIVDFHIINNARNTVDPNQGLARKFLKRSFFDPYLDHMIFSSTVVRKVICSAIAGFLPLTSAAVGVQAASVQLPTFDSTQRSINLSDPEQSPTSALPYIITPERRALLNTIRYAEGTWKRGFNIGYRVMFGGGLMPSLDRHPNRVIYSSRYASAAAGAYQFMPFTWALVKRSIGVQGFGPVAQDQGALYLVQRRKALPLTDTGVMSPQLAAKLAPEWASFPTLAGRSYYGQPVKRFSRLRSFYKVNLAQLREIRDQKRQGLKDGQNSSVHVKPMICTGPDILCELNLR